MVVSLQWAGRDTTLFTTGGGGSGYTRRGFRALRLPPFSVVESVPALFAADFRAFSFASAFLRAFMHVCRLLLLVCTVAELSGVGVFKFIH